uniref:Uncharacterized protein n=1 Tax=Ciona intestinalis TaxID=7719 RepID=H2XZS7_CIOIN
FINGVHPQVISPWVTLEKGLQEQMRVGSHMRRGTPIYPPNPT